MKSSSEVKTEFDVQRDLAAEGITRVEVAHRYATFLCSWDVDDSLVGQLTRVEVGEEGFRKSCLMHNQSMKKKRMMSC